MSASQLCLKSSKTLFRFWIQHRQTQLSIMRKYWHQLSALSAAHANSASTLTVTWQWWQTCLHCVHYRRMLQTCWSSAVQDVVDSWSRGHLSVNTDRPSDAKSTCRLSFSCWRHCAGHAWHGRIHQMNASYDAWLQSPSTRAISLNQNSFAVVGPRAISVHAIIFIALGEWSVYTRCRRLLKAYLFDWWCGKLVTFCFRRRV